MSDSRYEFHQQEVDSLKSAAIYTLAVCTNLRRMLEGIRDDQPRFASRGIHELLDPNYQCKSYVDKVDRLLAPVKIPVNVPIRSKMRRGSDGIHYEDMFPQVIELREEPIAHLAAWVIHDTVVSYLWKVWRRGNPGLVYCDALEATYDLVGPRWPEIRQELSGFVEYDYYSLRKAIEDESKAAIERCRQTIVDAAMATPNTAIDPSRTPPPPMPKPYWNRFDGKLSFDGEVIRKIRRIGNATNVVLVLDTFQELGWPDRVDSPLSGGGQQHHATISSLNEGLSRIRFQSDGEGKGFIWKAL